MGFDKFDVVINPHQPIFFPGQAVRGFIRARVSREVSSCIDITLKVTGKAKVHWSERRGKTTYYYNSKEKYFKITQVVWDGAEFGNRMPIGNHEFPFAVTLPLNIPSSFESNVGSVRYLVEAEVDRSFSFNQTARTNFSVNTTYDLNTDYQAAHRLHGEKDKTLCCMCCAIGPIHLELSADRQGYVSGENIVLNGEVHNNSRSIIKYTEAKIVQHINYITPSKTKTDTRTVQRIYRPQIQPGGRDKWDSVPLPVPPVPSSHLQYCNIIVIEYYVMLMAKLGCCKVANLQIPIVIGSIPLHGTIAMSVPNTEVVEVGGTTLPSTVFPPHPSMPRATPYQYSPSAPLPQTRAGDDPPPYSSAFLPPEYKDAPPPSYASCVFSGPQTRAMGRRGDDGAPRQAPNPNADDSDADEGGFAPHYITYGYV